MKILTSVQLKAVDRYTIEQEPVKSIDLMERVSVAMTRELLSRWPVQTRFVVFAGPGNNGGDALAIARLLYKAGAEDMSVFLFNVSGRLSEDCHANMLRLKDCRHVRFEEITTHFDFPDISAEDVIIDGLFGTGLNKPLSGGYAGLTQKINEAKAKKVSIDIPSGLMCEDNTYNVMTGVVKADLTLTVQMPKLSFFFPENQRFVGEVVAVDARLHPEAIRQAESSIYLLETEDVKKMLRPRPVFAHKGTMGHALIVSGSYGMAGATVLCARACLRSGVGKLTVHIPELNNNIMQCTVPEAIISHDMSDIIISKAIPTADFDALGIGPALGTEDETAEALKDFISHHDGALVVDADALNILGGHPDWLKLLPKDSILTPHPKELDNLVGQCQDSYDRLMKARALAVNLQVYIIVKGHNSMICTPAGRIIINPTGNAGMATAGSGDVLTGMLTGLLARGYMAGEACQIGVYLHGLAGDIAKERYGEESLVAGDIIDSIPAAFKQLND